jgi:hypothetical protein
MRSGAGQASHSARSGGASVTVSGGLARGASCECIPAYGGLAVTLVGLKRVIAGVYLPGGSP